jgi:hypothetical protein
MSTYTWSIRVSVPSSESAPPAPSPASECVPPLRTKGVGGNTLLRVRAEGAGEPNQTTGKKVWHSVYSVGSQIIILGRCKVMELGGGGGGARMIVLLYKCDIGACFLCGESAVASQQNLPPRLSDSL